MHVDLTLANFSQKKTIVAENLYQMTWTKRWWNKYWWKEDILSLIKQKNRPVSKSKQGRLWSILNPTWYIWTTWNCTSDEYKSALPISPDSDYELHLRRPIDSCFINDYFIAGLKGFAANVNLQPVFNH